MIPIAPRVLPVLGHVVPLMRDPLAFLTSLPECGDVVQIRLGPFRMVVVCDPGLTQQLLRDDRTFDKGGPIYDRIREVIGDGLASCPHSAHRRQRRLAQPAFHNDRLGGYADSATAIIAEVIDDWRDGQIVDVPTEIMTITTKSLTTTMFSSELPTAGLGRILDDINTIFASLYRRMLMPSVLRRLPILGNRSYQRAQDRLRRTIDELIAERRASGIDHGDLLSALLAVRDTESDGRGLTAAEIADTILTFFLAGSETTAAALAWALHLIARHADLERRLHGEVDSVLAGRTATQADLPKLELTRHIITETLRLYPPGWFFTRTVTTDIRLGEHTLPAGSIVAFSAYLIQRRPDLYDRPESFVPDRWDSLRHTQPSRHAFIPFSMGARKCIGDTYALDQAVLTLASIAARWRLEPLPDNEVRPQVGMVLRPRELRMRVVPRAV